MKPFIYGICFLFIVNVFATEPVSAVTDCRKGINHYLSFNVMRATRLSGEATGKLFFLASLKNPISVFLSMDARFLKYRFYLKLKKLKPATRKACMAQAKQLYALMLVFFQKRLDYLLTKGELNSYRTEVENLYAARVFQHEKHDIDNIVKKTDKKYLILVKERLMNFLKGSRWAFYKNIRFKLEVMGKHWTKLLGRNAPAAVNFDSRRIALKPHKFDEVSLIIFLFHEISHLADPEFIPDLDRIYPEAVFNNEVFAWNETLEFVKHLENKNIVIPELFKSIQRGVTNLGNVRRWVKLVIQR